MNDILTLKEVSEYLKLSDKTVLKMVKTGEIPCAKIANQWRFSKVMLNDWITARMEVIPQNDFSRLVEKSIDYIPISRLIDVNFIIPDLKGTTPSEVITELSEKAFENELISDKDEFIKKLLEREKLTSTSIGQGVALPHLRKPCNNIITEPKIIIGKSKKGIDFSSLDGKKTEIFLLLLSDSELVHLKIISKLSQILTIDDNMEKLRELETPEEFLKFFIIAEGSLKN